MAQHAGYWAETITKIKGAAVDALDLAGYEPVPEVQGMTDTWWRGEDGGDEACEIRLRGVRLRQARRVRLPPP